MDKFQYRDETEKGRYQHPKINDFTRLNKAVLKQGATNAAANRAMRQQHDLKVNMSQRNAISRGRVVGGGQAPPNMAFGKANRPQTPVGGIIRNNYGEEGELIQHAKYQDFMAMKPQGKGAINIRMTNAQMHADAAVRQKNVTMHETKAEFKLKRFQNVNPRTSTKRGDEGYMVNARRIASTGDVHENQ